MSVKKNIDPLPNDPHSADSAMALGREIRNLRLAHRFTLTELGERTNLSVGFLSKIERGLARPSVTTLQDIADALEVQVGWFFATDGPLPAEEKGVIVRSGNRRRLTYSGVASTDYLGMQDDLLSATLDRQIAMGITTYQPGGSTGDDLYTHEGEEAGFVLSGEIDLYLDDAVFRLREGDSFSFESDRPHRFVNPGQTQAKLVWCNTPVSLRRTSIPEVD